MISVIVPTYQDWPTLTRCLAGLAQQDVGVPYEILIADNNRDDLVPDMSLPENARVVPAPQPGSYAARNAALAQANGQIIAFTDADCVPDRSWLRQAWTILQDDPSISMVAGAIEGFWRSNEPTPVELCDAVFNLRQSRYVSRNVAATANLIVRRTVFEAVGPFDAKRFSGGDFEFARRATRQGFKLVYAPDAIVRHPVRSTLNDLLRKTRRVAGGHVAEKRAAGRRVFVPHLDRLIPCPKAARQIRSYPVGSLGVKSAAFAVYYCVQCARVYEQLRLTVFRRDYERR